jgi:ectoine hydroxylase-related dioxygenase (phytanoyl-CoA dioxygenase family)
MADPASWANLSVVGTEHREAVAADGVCVVRNLLTTDGIAGLRNVVAAELSPAARHSATGPRRRFHNDGYLWRRHAELREFCLHSGLPALAALLLDVDQVRLLMDEVFVKEPDTDVPVPWHNDASYWPVGGAPMGSFWFALDKVSADNGAVVFHPGSHHNTHRHEPTSFLQPNGPLAVDPDARLCTWTLEAGDALFFTAFTEHHSPGNSSDSRRRRAYTVRYASSAVRYQPREGTSPLMQVPGLNAGSELPDHTYPLAGHPDDV